MEVVRVKGNDFRFETPHAVLKWAVEKYRDKVALASSFGAEDVVLIDMLSKISPGARVFTIDTGRLPEETYNTMDEIKNRYDIRLEVYFPDSDLIEDMVEKHGFNLFRKSIELRELCCEVRKVKPLNRVLSGLDAWICGLRREQSVTRMCIENVEFEKRVIGGNPREIVKLNPLIDWSEDQVWNYIIENEVPYNALHDRGYPSIGCDPCTRAVKPGEDVRAGRWWWEPSDKKECGLHCKRQ